MEVVDHTRKANVAAKGNGKAKLPRHADHTVEEMPAVKPGDDPDREDLDRENPAHDGG